MVNKCFGQLWTPINPKKVLWGNALKSGMNLKIKIKTQKNAFFFIIHFLKLNVYLLNFGYNERRI